MKILTPNLVLESAPWRGTTRLPVKATESGRNSRGFKGMDPREKKIKRRLYVPSTDI